ncbi:hypothetical protein [Pseudobacteriovorax antillogorgiicola]|uniref:Uncharacterized protein n=1 Tax=Pseudobacteriovorax antillogorgiicola TaxID=1513793 RepID=A0A1Y6CPI7_9BACT|nr:hypothetical protein [Pseudobacteriovorax antillogorgiicola]TCS43655.1 hypothetical protein EDD56_13548 [Pseudobacteriovorax antillogorgiicola]SMF79863.1 hypothetical protein SAMN06296036_1345 [Pseudobacteriovorax antillogorgiicola]
MFVSKPSNDIQGKLAPVRSNQNWKTLYLPNSGECYDSLLDGGMDSQVYSYDLNQYVRAYDRRFVISMHMRDLVESKAKYSYPGSCKYVETRFAAKETRCETLGDSGVDYCSLAPQGAGYFVYLWMEDSSKSFMVFNRWD